MSPLVAVLASPAVSIALIAGAAWAPVTGLPTWPAVTRSRFASTAPVSAAMATFAFGVVRHACASGAV